RQFGWEADVWKNTQALVSTVRIHQKNGPSIRHRAAAVNCDIHKSTATLFGFLVTGYTLQVES
ncbi:MAG: hypothetical protein KBA18_07440, partial [Kiritimatiellae bacterium]|nr:hypothetical protein [Kiritimatiellia bacterium]